MRAGRANIAVTKASAEQTAIPAMRNGSRTTQMSGNNSTAISATGQQITQRMHQSRNFTIPDLLQQDLTHSHR